MKQHTWTILLLVVFCSLAFLIGQDVGSASKKGEISQLQTEVNQLKEVSSEYDLTTSALQTKYNFLSDDYDELVGKYNRLVSTPVYTPSKRISCTSNAIGSFVYTNCF